MPRGNTWRERIEQFPGKQKSMAQAMGVLALLSAALINRGFVVNSNPATFGLIGLLVALGCWTWKHRSDWDTPSSRLVAAAFILLEAVGFRLEIYYLGGQADAWALPIATLISLAAPIYFPRILDYAAILLLIWLTLIPASTGSIEPWRHTGLLSLFITCVVISGMLINLGFNQLVHRLIESGEVYRKLSEIDHLTGASNRRTFLDKLEATAKTGPYVFVMIDLDSFKAINDRLGHAAGDGVLVAFAKLLADLPDSFECGRLGGEEFGLFSKGDCIEAVEAGLVNIARSAATGPVPFTFSAGAIRAHPEHSIGDVLRQADEQLYVAKRGGKAQLCLAGRTVRYFGAQGVEPDVVDRPSVALDDRSRPN